MVSNHIKDQLRIKKTIEEASNKFKPSLIKEKKTELSNTPDYKKYRNKSISGSALIGAASGGLAGGLTSKNFKRGLLSAGLGAIAGGGFGLGRSRRVLARKSESSVNKDLDNLLRSESGKTYAVHKYLSAPGIQNVIVNRPWGKESYSG